MFRDKLTHIFSNTITLSNNLVNFNSKLQNIWRSWYYTYHLCTDYRWSSQGTRKKMYWRKLYCVRTWQDMEKSFLVFIIFFLSSHDIHFFSTSFPNRLYANFAFFIINLILDTTRRYIDLSQRRQKIMF